MKKLVSKLPTPAVWIANISLFTLYLFLVEILFIFFDVYVFGNILEEESEVIWDLLIYSCIFVTALLSIFLSKILYFKVDPSKQDFKGFLIVIGYVLLIDILGTIINLIYGVIYNEHRYLTIIETLIFFFFTFVAYKFFTKSTRILIYLFTYLFINILLPFVYKFFSVDPANVIREISFEYWIYIGYCIIACVYLLKSQNVKQTFHS